MTGGAAGDGWGRPLTGGGTTGRMTDGPQPWGEGGAEAVWPGGRVTQHPPCWAELGSVKESQLGAQRAGAESEARAGARL